MPATSVKAKQTNVRLPVDLIEWIATQDGSQAEVIVRGLNALRLGDHPSGRMQLQASLAELRDKVARLTTERDQWRDRAKAIVGSAGKTVRRGTDPMGRQHAAGPVKASAVPEVPGSVGWCGLKGLDKPAKAGR
jgi:hypothetical protein